MGADHLGYLIYLYDSVLGFDKAGRIEPELAESWELPDDVTYIFNMRPGAIFQDGAACDAHALQANMDYLSNTEDLAGQDRAQAGISKAVSREVVDDLSWRMVNSEPFAPTLVNFLASPGTGMLISPAHFETTITDPVGAGPMRQTDYNEGENWVTERWDGYWDNDNGVGGRAREADHPRRELAVERLPLRRGRLVRPARRDDAGGEGSVDRGRLPGIERDGPDVAADLVQPEPGAGRRRSTCSATRACAARRT